jgi:hypothetical protein
MTWCVVRCAVFPFYGVSIMRKALIGAVIATASLSSVSAHAADACATVLCMFGMVEGQQPGACNSEIADYFSIVEFHHGHPDLSATAKSRLSFTQQCSSAPANFISSIDQAFGSVIK